MPNDRPKEPYVIPKPDRRKSQWMPDELTLAYLRLNRAGQRLLRAAVEDLRAAQKDYTEAQAALIRLLERHGFNRHD